MKKIVALFLTLAVLGGAVALADTIKMGTNAEFAPFEYIGDDGKPTGFDVEIAGLIAAGLGKDLEIEDIYFDGLLAALDVGTVDFVIAAMTIRPDRLEAALFSTPYFSAVQSVIVKEGYDGITSLEDLTDKKIAVQDGTTGFFLVTDDLGCDPANISAFKASPDTVLELQAGRVDCIVIDNAVAELFVKLNDGLVIVQGIDVPVEEYGIAVNLKNPELIEQINAILAQIKEDGTYDALLTKYFASEVEE